MGGRVVFIDLAKDRSGVLDPVLTPQAWRFSSRIAALARRPSCRFADSARLEFIRVYA
jgi:hypothetical protein